MASDYWIIIKDINKFSGKELSYSKRGDWTTKSHSQLRFKTHQKAYAVLNKLKEKGENCKVVGKK